MLSAPQTKLISTMPCSHDRRLRIAKIPERSVIDESRCRRLPAAPPIPTITTACERGAAKRAAAVVQHTAKPNSAPHPTHHTPTRHDSNMAMGRGGGKDPAMFKQWLTGERWAEQQTPDVALSDQAQSKARAPSSDGSHRTSKGRSSTRARARHAWRPSNQRRFGGGYN